MARRELHADGTPHGIAEQVHGFGEAGLDQFGEHVGLRLGAVVTAGGRSAAAEAREVRRHAVQAVGQHPHQIGPVGGVATEAVDEQRRGTRSHFADEQFVPGDFFGPTGDALSD